MREAPGAGATGLVVAALLLFLGFLVTSALVEERRREEQLPSKTAALLDLIRTREAGIDELSDEAQALSSRLEQLRRARAEESGRLEEAIEGLTELEALASAAPARGSGVTIELADSDSVPQTRGELTDLRIQDVDLRLVVNALWQAGAEAIAVNDHRIGETTAIRSAGDRILVNFAPVASPYRVTAIGEPEALESGLDETEISEQFDVWTQVYGLGFSVRSGSDLSVPGLDVPARLEWAEPVKE